MEFVILAILAALIAHGVEVVRDEHGHARSSAAQQLRSDHPERSDGWVRRHAWYRAIAHWPRIPRVVRQAWREDRAYIRLRRTQGDVGHLRRMEQWREELKRAEEERNAAVAAAIASGDGVPESPGGRHRKDPEASHPADTSGEAPGEPPADTSTVPDDDPPGGELADRIQGGLVRENPASAGTPAPGEHGHAPANDYARPEPETPVTFGPESGHGYQHEFDPLPGPPRGSETRQAVRGITNYPDAEPMPEPQSPDHSNEMEQELWQADQERRRNGGAPSPATNGGTVTAPTGTMDGTPTGEAPSYDDAKKNAGSWLEGFKQQLSALEQHQTDVATAGDLAGDQNVMGALDQALDHVRNAADAMQQHLNGLNQHQPGQEYADAVPAPADTNWLKSQ
jgi:hypothetical protein